MGPVLRLVKWLVVAAIAAFEFLVIWGASSVVVARFWAEQPGHWNGYDAAAKQHALLTALVVWAALGLIQFAIAVMVHERRGSARLS